MSDNTEETVDLEEYDQIYHLRDKEKSYVGRVSIVAKDGTPRGVQERENEHFQAADRQEIRNCARLLTAAIIKQGADAFQMSVLETVHKDKGSEREIFWINELNAVHPHGYNLMGGANGRYSIHPETKELMSQSLRSFGKNAQKRFNIKVERKALPKCVGYRGFYNGVPKGFFSNSLTEEEKKAKAIHYNVTGEHEYDRRIPRLRKHTDENDDRIEIPGVKANFRSGRIQGYRAYHPTRTELTSKTCSTLDEAIEFNKVLLSLPENDVPEEFLAKERPERPDDMAYIKGPKKHPGSKNIPKGTLVGYEVAIPARVSKSGKDTTKAFSTTAKPLEENLKSAIAYRNLNMRIV